MYVDDNYAVGTKEGLKWLIEELPKRGLNITVEHNTKDYLSCEIVFDSKKKKAWIGQPHMVKKIRKEFQDDVKGMQKYNTPGSPGLGLTLAKTEEEKVDDELHARYRTGTGMLLYLIKHSRPDISNAVRELSKCLSAPTRAAYKEMLRVIKYVLDTPQRGLRVDPVTTNKWTILLYSDSDWAGDKDSRKSITGFLIFVCGVLVCWRSKSQACVGLSSSEAEYYALTEAVKEVPFIAQMLLFMGVKIELPIKIKVDNMGAVYMAEGSVNSARTRHIDTLNKYVVQLQEEGLIKVEFTPSNTNKSDPLTKNLQGDLFQQHIIDLVRNRDQLD